MADERPERTDLFKDGVLRIKDAAKFIGFGESETRKLVKDGKLVYAKVGKRLLISRVSLVEFLNSNRVV